MTCEDVRPKLTAYLDGDLEGDRGSAVRGHLRSCTACRTAADDEAALRDGLRALPPLDAPSGMWAKIQTQLAAAEIADSEKPRWRRVLARWHPQHWVTPRLALASGAVAVIFCVWVWRSTHRDPGAATAFERPLLPSPPAPAAPGAEEHPPGSLTDVATEIAALPKTTGDAYAVAVRELEQLATTERASWSEAQQKQFDAKVTALAHDIAAADEGRPRQRAYRGLIRYLERATSRDEVAFADTRGTP